MVDAWGREDRDEDPLAKLERLVNARTDRMVAGARTPTRAPASAGLRGAIEDLYGTPARQRPVEAVRQAPPDLPEVPLEFASPEPDAHALAAMPVSDLPDPLPSLSALRGGWADDLPPPPPEPVEPMPRVVRGADPRPEPAIEADIGAELDTDLSEAVASALAAASAALAATQTHSPTVDRPEAIQPLPIPEPPAYEASAVATPEAIDFGDDFERELVDELMQIEPTAIAPEADPLVGPADVAFGVPEGDPAVRAADNDNGGRRRGAMIAAMLAGVAVLGGVGAFALNGSPDAPVEVAVVRADPAPVKVRPENPGGRTVPNQSNAVYERVAEVENAQAKAAPASRPATAIVDETEDVSAIRETAVAATATPPRDAAARSVDVAPRDTIAPRPVRTIRVRPDGTLATMPPAGAAPTAPSVPAAPPVEVATANAAEPVVEPVSDAADEIAGVAADVPLPRFRPYRVASAPASAPIVPAAPETPEADVASTASIGTQPIPPVAPGGYVVQIASVPNAAAAESTYRDLAARHAAIIGGRGVDYQVADIPGKGTFHRVRIPAGSKAEASTICSQLKASGGACFVTR